MAYSKEWWSEFHHATPERQREMFAEEKRRANDEWADRLRRQWGGPADAGGRAATHRPSATTTHEDRDGVNEWLRRTRGAEPVVDLDQIDLTD